MNQLIQFTTLSLGVVLLVPTISWTKKMPKVSLQPDFFAFSPNKDGVQDQLLFRPKLEKIKSISTWELQVRDANGTIRRTFSGTKNLPDSILWDGADDFGAPCLEGSYQVLFSIWYSKNRQLDASPINLALDLTPPALSISLEEKSALLKEELLLLPTFYLSAVDLSGISNWKLKVQDETKGELYFQASSGTPVAFLKIPALSVASVSLKKVTALFSVTDQAGNSGTAAPLDLSIKREATKKSAEPQDQTALMQSARAEKFKEDPTAFLQMTAIIFISELFGSEATQASSLLPQAKSLLDPIAKVLLESPDSRATILAHVDAGKSRNEDKALSSYFAWRIFSYLVKEKGVEKNALSVRGLGSDVPIASNQSSLGRARNRRIEIQFFLPKQ